MDTVDRRLSELLETSAELVGLLRGDTQARTFDPNSIHARLFSFFLVKACKTHDAIVVLASGGFGEDAAILARSLLNLAINVRWINQDPGKRVPAYVDFGVILSARYNRKLVGNPKLGGQLNEDQMAHQQRQQEELDRAAKLACKRHGYNCCGWSGKSIRCMAVEVGLADEYDSVYALTSELEHSNVGSADEYMGLEPDGRITVSGAPSQNWVVESLGIAQLYLIDIAKETDSVLELSIAKELTALHAKVLKVFGARLMEPT